MSIESEIKNFVLLELARLDPPTDEVCKAVNEVLGTWREEYEETHPTRDEVRKMIAEGKTEPTPSHPPTGGVYPDQRPPLEATHVLAQVSHGNWFCTGAHLLAPGVLWIPMPPPPTTEQLKRSAELRKDQA